MNNMHLKSNLIENHKLVSIVKDVKLATLSLLNVPIHIKLKITYNPQQFCPERSWTRDLKIVKIFLV